jgi:hypothetical protein
VPALPCPALVVSGDEFDGVRGSAVAGVYSSEELNMPGLDHWNLVRNPATAAAVSRWLGGGNPSPHTQ